jgi:hypothetical protein
MIILRLYRSPLLHRWIAVTDVTAAEFSPRPPQHMSPHRYGGQSYRLHDAQEMVCL